MLIATMATLIVELRLIVTTVVVHLLLVLLWVVHISHLLLLLTSCGFLLAAFHDQLKHLELVFLHGPHVRHLLLVDSFRLLKHATVVSSWMSVIHFNHALFWLGGCLYLDLWKVDNFLYLWGLRLHWSSWLNGTAEGSWWSHGAIPVVIGAVGSASAYLFEGTFHAPVVILACWPNFTDHLVWCALAICHVVKNIVCQPVLSRHFTLTHGRAWSHTTAASLSFLNGNHEAFSLFGSRMSTVHGCPSVTICKQKIVLVVAHHVGHSNLSFVDGTSDISATLMVASITLQSASHEFALDRVLLV